LECAKDVYTCFAYLMKAYDEVSREKLWGVLREVVRCWRPLVAGRQVIVLLLRRSCPCRCS